MRQKPLRKIEILPKTNGPRHSDLVAVRQHPVEEPYSSREYGPVDTIVIHATAGSSSAGAVSVMEQGTASWHYLVPDENETAHGEYVWAHTPLDKKAWHVLRRIEFPKKVGGLLVKRSPGHNDINSRAYGIEVVNQQKGSVDPFSSWQVEAVAGLVHRLRLRQNNGMYLVTHSYLDPDRKSDPGAHFPWEKLVARVHELAAKLKVVLLPENTVIPCHPRIEDGKTRCDLRQVVEALGKKATPHLGRNRIYVHKERGEDK